MTLKEQFKDHGEDDAKFREQVKKMFDSMDVDGGGTRCLQEPSSCLMLHPSPLLLFASPYARALSLSAPPSPEFIWMRIAASTLASAWRPPCH